MKKPFDEGDESRKKLRDKIIGLGESSMRKSYYPELQKRISELEAANHELIHQIEENRKTEKALLDSEKGYREIFNSTDEAIFIHDALDGSVLDVNNAAIKMFGFSSKEHVLVTEIQEMSSGVYPYDGKVASEKLRKAATGITQNFEWYARRFNGELFWTEVSLRKSTIGGEDRVLAVIRDVSERKRAELALKESERRYQTLALVSPVGIFRTNANGDTVYVNPQWCQISGLSVKEALGDGWLKAVHPDDVERLIQGWRSATMVKNESIAEYRFLRPDGKVIWVLGQATPEVNHKNQIVGYVGTITDITKIKETEEKLKENEAFLSDIVNAQPTGIYRVRLLKESLDIFDLDNFFILDFVNQQFYDIIGINREEFGNDLRKLITVVHPDEIQGFIELNKWAVENKADFYWEGRIVFNGQHKWISLESVPRQLPNGDMVWTGVLNDINSRRNAAEALRKSEERYKTLFMNARDGICVSFVEYLVFANPRVGEMLGYSMEELLSIPYAWFIHPDDQEFVIGHYLGLFENKNFKNLPARFITKSGETRYFELNALVIEWEGQPAVLSFITDITEKKIAQDQLRASEERFRLIFENAPIGVLNYDKNGVILACNNQFIEILGSSREKLIGLPMLKLPNLEVVNTLKKALEGVRAIYEGEYTSVTGTKATQIRLQFAPIWDAFGNVDGGVGIVEDFAERIRNEKLEQEIAVAKKSAEFKQNFLANMSHEIRTPLTGIEGMAHILAKTHLSEEQNDYLETIIYSSQNLREIINQILDYSKIEAGRMTIKPRVFKTSELAVKTEKLFSSLCGNRIPYKMLIGKDLPEYLEADDMRVFQIVTNFISNAVKYAPNGLIQFAMDKIGHRKKNQIEIKVEVADQGAGIQKEKQQELFAPFSQLEHDDQRSIEGTGLGLSISKELAEMMGGSIGVESEVGNGSKFWFTFLAQTASKPDESFALDAVVDMESEPKRILLVEDKKVNQKVITLMLQSLGHYVSVAGDGQQALDVFQDGIYDLILMDIQMPVMDGITATKTLKSRFSNLPPIVGLSANAFEGDKEKYMSMGMDDYLTKPVKEEDFKDLIQRLF